MLHRYDSYGWLRGFNVIASWGARIEQAWWDYEPGRMREEVALAAEAHANCIRLWIEFTAWMADPEGVTASFLDAVTAIDECGMRAMPCMFNRWHDRRWDYGGTYLEDLDRGWESKLAYVRALVEPLAADERVLVWDLCNEPQARSLETPQAEREFAWLSAAAERNEDIIYVCYDNEAYQNTGNQRSSATPFGSVTTTNLLPASKAESKKDIMMLMATHNIPYAATATSAYPDDLIRKAQKAKGMKGFRFFHILTPCPTGWLYPPEWTVKISRLAVDTKVFPIFEVEDGFKLTINCEPEGTPLEEYVGIQGRFKHLKSEQIAILNKSVEEKWNRLQWLASYGR